VLWLPATLIALAMVAPLAYLVIRGAGASEETWSLLFRARTAELLWRSVVLMATVTTVSVALGVPLAWLTVRSDIPLRRFWSVVAVLPLVVPSYVGALVVVSALGPTGLLRDILDGPLGVQRLPEIYGLSGTTLTLALLNYPLVLLIVKGALNGLDPALGDSARSLGVSPAVAVLRVTLPQLKPAIASGSLLVALYTLSDFGAVSLLGYETFTWAIYQQYQTSFDRSVASSLSLVLVAVAATVLVLEARSRGRARYYRTGPGAARPPAVVPLGRWRWPAVALCAAVGLAAVAGPVAVLGYWVGQGIAAGEREMLLWGELWNSVLISGAAALVTAACSVPIAALAVRYPSPISQLVERLSFTGYALPGVVVALSLVFVGVNVVRPVYQTGWMLLFAYVVLFLPVALGATRSAMMQASPGLEEAARGLGRTPLQTLLTVIVPQMRSGMLVGVALVFLVAIKELPATLILGPLGFQTLATAVWSASSEAFYARASAPALMLVLVSSIPMAALVWRGERLRA